MDQVTARKVSPGVLTDIPRHAPSRAQLYRDVPAATAPWLNLALFVATLLTTTMAGADMANAELSLSHPLASLAALSSGLSFSVPLMTILLAHEMGHYLTSRYHRVDASLPYFIPAPFPSLFLVGTFGAFIRMRSRADSRREMFDIGAAGPWAGMLVAIPCVFLGLRWSTFVSHPITGGLEFGDSLLFRGIERLVWGAGQNFDLLILHPVALAGWIGFFVTALNLLPVGQLDGGHVVYALFPRQHRRISTLFVMTCVAMVAVPLMLGWSFWGGWLIWAVLSIALGLGHPATLDQDRPLDPRRRLAAWATIGLFILTFSWNPVSFSPPSDQDEPQSNGVSVMQRLPHAPAIDHAIRAHI